MEWLAVHEFAVVVIDTAGLLPDQRLIDALQTRQTPVLVLTNASNQTEWTEAAARLEVKEFLSRPVLIGDLTRVAARLAMHTHT
jgi:response regulator RpfG family c-di-GMP phosphodiesterase